MKIYTDKKGTEITKGSIVSATLQNNGIERGPEIKIENSCSKIFFFGIKVLYLTINLIITFNQ